MIVCFCLINQYKYLNNYMKKQFQQGNERKKLQYQLSYSEHVNKELSDQLALLQQKLGISNKVVKTDQNSRLINHQAHLQQLYYVEPLILGYQHKIQLLQQEVKSLAEQSKDLHEFAQEIVSENNFLRQQLQSKNKYVLKCEQVGINVNFIKLDNDSLKQKIQIMQQKNKFLQKKLKEIQQTKDNEQRKKIKLFTQQELQKAKAKLVQQIREKQIIILETNKNKQLLANQLDHEKAINNELTRKQNQLQNQIQRLKNQIKIIKQQYQTYQTTYENASGSLETEILNLKSQLNLSSRKQNELFNKTMLLQSQIQDKNTKCHNLTIQNSQLQTNNNNILQMLETYEVKVNSLNKKLKSLQQQRKQQNQNSSENQKNFELLEWKLSEKQRELQRKEIQWRKQRQRIAKMWEDRIETLKKGLENERQQLYQEIQNLKIQKVKFQIKNK